MQRTRRRIKLWLALLPWLLSPGCGTSMNDQADDLWPEWQAAELEQEIDALREKYEHMARRAESGLTRFYYDPYTIAEGRLTTESGVAVSTSDRAAQSTIYYTPYMGAAIALYSGSIWKVHYFTQISLALSGLTSDTNYDVFLYDNSGTLTLELTAWSSATARATGLVLQDGIFVRSGATTRRYLGTIRTTSTTTTEDSRTKRFVWNWQNRVLRTLFVGDTTDSWTYATDTWRSANGSAANRVEYVTGVDDSVVFARSMLIAQSSAGRSDFISSGIGVDSTSVNSAQIRGSGTAAITVKQAWGFYVGYPGLGYHFLQWLERSNATSITLYGDNGDATKYQSGLLAEIRA